MEWMQILAVVEGVMILFVLWPAYKHWSANSPKAEQGDWQADLFSQPDPIIQRRETGFGACKCQ